MKILVTGIAGFMGSHIAETLLQQGHQVLGIDNLIGGYRDNVPEDAEFINEDLTNLATIRPCFADVDVVIHSACTAYEGLSVFSPALVVQNTAQITATVMSASVSQGVKKVIYLSSMARYGANERVPFTEDLQPKPQDPYGIAKVCAEELVKNVAETHGLDWVILVPHNIIGPRQKYDDPFRNVASIMTNRMLRGLQPYIYGDGEQRRCFSFMTDVVNPVLKTVTSDVGNREVINIGPDEEFVSINELARRIALIIEFELDPIYVPGRPQEVRDANCSAEKTRRLLGYRTSTGLDDGLRSLVNYIKNRGPKEFTYHLPIEFSTPKTPRTWTERLI